MEIDITVPPKRETQILSRSSDDGRFALPDFSDWPFCWQLPCHVKNRIMDSMMPPIPRMTSFDQEHFACTIDLPYLHDSRQQIHFSTYAHFVTMGLRLT